MKTQLKYLGLTLAAHIRIAKRLARPSKTPARFIPDLQRDQIALKNEARATNIAIGFLRGQALGDIEALPYRPKNEGHIGVPKGEAKPWGSYSHPNWDRVEDLVMAHGRDYIAAGLLFGSEQELQQKFAEFVSPRYADVCSVKQGKVA